MAETPMSKHFKVYRPLDIDRLIEDDEKIERVTGGTVTGAGSDGCVRDCDVEAPDQKQAKRDVVKAGFFLTYADAASALLRDGEEYINLDDGAAP